MTATLRVVLEQPWDDGRNDLAVAGVQLTRALVATSPAGCDVSALIPAGAEDADAQVPGLTSVRALPLQRRELLAAWQLGVAPTSGGGLVHSPTFAAPLVRHDRANSTDQTVVTLWDMRAWDAPLELHRAAVAWQKGMLKRAAKHADAVIVPTFAHASRLEEEVRLGDRLRVIAGAAPAGFSVPSDVAARARDLRLPESFVAVAGDAADSDGLVTALRGATGAVKEDRDVVVFDTTIAGESAVRDAIGAAGIALDRVHIRQPSDAGDRATIIGTADALISATTRTAWPWRVVEALALGTPVVAVATPVLTDVVGDAGLIVGADDLASAVAEALGSRGQILRVLSADRGRTYSWESAAERVWQLHAEI